MSPCSLIRVHRHFIELPAPVLKLLFLPWECRLEVLLKQCLSTGGTLVVREFTLELALLSQRISKDINCIIKIILIYVNKEKNVYKMYSKNTSKESVCGLLIAGIAGSNPPEGMDVRLLCSLRVVKVVSSAMSWSLVRRSPTWCVGLCMI